MTSEPAVAIVIPCYNPRSFLAEALESALGQTHRNLDVVVVNDGSRRGFWETVSPYRDAVRILEQPNAGVAAARNRAIEASDAPLIAFLDQDDRWRPEKIARQVHFLAEHHECALVHTGRRFIDANGEQIPKPGPVWAPAEGSCLDRLILHNTIQPSSVLLRRAALGSE